MINPFGKYIQMTKKMIELLINGYEYYENERKNKDDENKLKVTWGKRGKNSSKAGYDPIICK